jgi:hypothetical protein
MKMTDKRVLKEARFTFFMMFFGITIITAVGVGVKYSKFGVFKPEGLLLAFVIFTPVLMIFSWIYAYFEVVKKEGINKDSRL